MATAAMMAATPSSRVAWCRSGGRRRRSPSSLSLKVRRRCTWAGSSRWAQLDVQVGRQQSSLGGGGQGGLSTSSPHPGVKEAEELPMVGVKHLLSMGCPQLTFWNQNLNFRKIFENSKSCDWSLLVLITFDCPDADVTMQDFTCPGSRSIWKIAVARM